MGGQMSTLNVSQFMELKQGDSKIFLGVTTLGDLEKAGFSYLDSDSRYFNFIELICSEVHQNSFQQIELVDPILRYNLPVGRMEFEYPLLIVLDNHFLPFVLENALLKFEEFNVVIEKGPKLSKNSTKVMTLVSLREILIHVFKHQVSVDESKQMITALKNYIRMLQERFRYLGYLPVQLRIKYRERFVGDLSFAWEMYLRFFYDQWLEKTIINIPDIAKEKQYQSWSGEFFDRNNPLWTKTIGYKKKVRLNKTDKESIYKIWKEWIREP
ncbi:hypothetical protein Q5741_02830 [Paenibacillus sp. JX-17]|uniref:Uncharacterized protein n=1 Tax=Paenibacillus lacisoli TaxID=3064525 RepID=A0ABT9C7X0_9BACL|nr:hypothetical protein [Paenibacillus sp. JX-17]MDO7905346.1 hypothetical protein [Paenibacillus sp. JX-17]